MTWNELGQSIERLTFEQQEQDVTIYVRGVDEFYPVTKELKISDEIK